MNPIQTYGALSKSEDYNFKLLRDNDWDSIIISENLITIAGKGILNPTAKVLEFIFQIVTIDKPEHCKGFVQYMKTKGRLKKFYADIGDKGKVAIMAAVLGSKEE